MIYFRYRGFPLLFGFLGKILQHKPAGRLLSLPGPGGSRDHRGKRPHPEAYPETRELVVAMVKALTGREIHPPAKYFRRYQAFGKGPLMDAVRRND